MSETSILLELDGSAQSRYAAELVWSLATKNNWVVNAQHVVDSLAAWDFLNFDIAGFIGSGPYFEAHETMRTCLTKIGENLVEAYLGNAAGHGVEGQTYLDDGTTIREICWRAKEHALVVIGQRGTGMTSPDDDKRRLPRRSIAETLTYYCPRPLLVVQDRMQIWKNAEIWMSEGEEMPQGLVDDCLSFLKSNGIEPSLKAVYVNSNLEQLQAEAEPAAGEAYFQQLAKTVKGAAAIKSTSVEVKNVFSYLAHHAENNPETLLVIPVAEHGGTRKTSFGINPDLILRYQTHSAVLFWIEPPPADEYEQETASAATSEK